ncbi:hypothetical protein [Streptomyces sp. AM6-12]|uniref:hypothetical protein n=1 Tax=Streptomyces sp. AM6-12 TaxID=3345149 RepID=UPI0037B81693
MSQDQDGAAERAHAWRQYMAELLADCPQPPVPAAEPERQPVRSHDENGQPIDPW